jgi:hypothetical protein
MAQKQEEGERRFRGRVAFMCDAVDPTPRQIGFLVSSTDPVPGYQSYGGSPAPEHPTRNQGAGRRAALAVCTIADIAAGLLGLWILLFLLDANQGNGFVEFVHGTADWLAGWAQDIFTMETEGLRVLLNYGLPAVIYLLIGHGIAARLNRA